MRFLSHAHGCPAKDSLERCNTVNRKGYQVKTDSNDLNSATRFSCRVLQHSQWEGMRHEQIAGLPLNYLQILNLTLFEKTTISSPLQRFGDPTGLDFPSNQLKLFEF